MKFVANQLQSEGSWTAANKIPTEKKIAIFINTHTVKSIKLFINEMKSRVNRNYNEIRSDI